MSNIKEKYRLRINGSILILEQNGHTSVVVFQLSCTLFVKCFLISGHLYSECSMYSLLMKKVASVGPYPGSQEKISKSGYWRGNEFKMCVTMLRSLRLGGIAFRSYGSLYKKSCSTTSWSGASILYFELKKQQKWKYLIMSSNICLEVFKTYIKHYRFRSLQQN